MQHQKLTQIFEIKKLKSWHETNFNKNLGDVVWSVLSAHKILIKSGTPEP